MNDDDGWSMATGEDNGRPLIFRVRNEPPAFVQKTAYPHLLAIAWPYESDNEADMPAVEDAERMGELEEFLVAALEGDEAAFLTVIVTGNGVREWQWYAGDPQRVMEVVNQTLGELEPFPIEIVFQEDPEWQGYEGFREIFESPE